LAFGKPIADTLRKCVKLTLILRRMVVQAPARVHCAKSIDSINSGNRGAFVTDIVAVEARGRCAADRQKLAKQLVPSTTTSRVQSRAL